MPQERIEHHLLKPSNSSEEAWSVGCSANRVLIP